MWWRRRVWGQVLVGWRAPRADVRAALEQEEVPAAVGPTEVGWTVVRLLVDGDSVVEPRGRGLLDLLDDLARTLRAPAAVCAVEDWNERELLVVAPGRPVVSARVPGLAAGGTPDRSGWVEVLRTLGDLSALEPVLAAAVPQPVAAPDLVAAAMADRRHRAVALAAGLPVALLEPDAAPGVGPGAVEREVVVVGGVEAPDVDVAASVLRVTLQAADLAGTTVVATDPLDGRNALPVLTMLADRRHPGLLLWRQRDARGYQVRRGDVEDGHVWLEGWEVVAPSGHLAEHRQELAAALLPAEGDAAVLAAHAAPGRDVDLLALRSLLRRRPDGRVLSELCALLGLDPRVAEVVEGERPFPDLPGARTVVPTSARSAIWAAATAPRASDPWVVRVGREKPWWWRAADLVWVVVALVWAAGLWSGGVGAKVGAAVLALTAVWSLYDAVTRAAAPRASAPERPAGLGS